MVSLQHMSLENIRIVLVEPSHPGNIGATARAMKTMGIGHLALVRPQRFPDPQAEWRAASAGDVIDRCRVFDNLETAVGDCQWVVGTSARPRRIPWPVSDVREAAAEVVQQARTGSVAALFGRETSGLTNDELQRCNRHLQIPASKDYPSLNLAMAVQVVTYEIFRQAGAAKPRPPAWDRAPATAAAVEALLTHLETTLVETEFLDPENPGQVLTRLRRLFTRVQLDETEVGMLRGILTHFGRHDASGAPPRKSGGNPSQSPGAK